MKIKTLLLLSMIATNTFGGQDRGGGDQCENRFDEVKEDIKSWILKGGPKHLNLPQGVSVNSYTSKMLEQMLKAEVKCVGPDDQDYPVFIEDTKTGEKIPKVCRFDLTPETSKITCDFLKFNSLHEKEDSEYVLVHHEYAGLAQIESPDGVRSRYDISNQLAAFLEEKIVKKLAVKPRVSMPQGKIETDKLPGTELAEAFHGIPSYERVMRSIELTKMEFRNAQRRYDEYRNIIDDRSIDLRHGADATGTDAAKEYLAIQAEKFKVVMNMHLNNYEKSQSQEAKMIALLEEYAPVALKWEEKFRNQTDPSIISLISNEFWQKEAGEFKYKADRLREYPYNNGLEIRTDEDGISYNLNNFDMVLTDYIPDACRSIKISTSKKRADGIHHESSQKLLNILTDKNKRPLSIKCHKNPTFSKFSYDKKTRKIDIYILDRTIKVCPLFQTCRREGKYEEPNLYEELLKAFAK